MSIDHSSRASREVPAYEVYADQLFRRGHGYPLWDPQPTKRGPVLIGDVGYLQNGAFFRIFNATLPADDPINSHYGVPEGFRPLRSSEFPLNRRDAAIPSGPLCSRSIRATAANASLDM